MHHLSVFGENIGDMNKSVVICGLYVACQFLIIVTLIHPILLTINQPKYVIGQIIAW